MYPMAYNYGPQTFQPTAHAGPSFAQYTSNHFSRGQNPHHTMPRSISGSVTQFPNHYRYLLPPSDVGFTHRGGIVGLPVNDILKNPETFIMDDGKSMLNLQMDNDGLIQYCINWPGYDEWVFTSFLTTEPNSLLGHRRARPSTKRQLAISLAAAIQLFHEDSCARPYDPAQAGGCMAWQLSYFGYERLVLRQLRYLSPGRWEIEVVASSDSLVASSSMGP